MGLNIFKMFCTHHKDPTHESNGIFTRFTGEVEELESLWLHIQRWGEKRHYRKAARQFAQVNYLLGYPIVHDGCIRDILKKEIAVTIAMPPSRQRDLLLNFEQEIARLIAELLPSLKGALLLCREAARDPERFSQAQQLKLKAAFGNCLKFVVKIERLAKRENAVIKELAA